MCNAVPQIGAGLVEKDVLDVRDEGVAKYGHQLCVSAWNKGSDAISMMFTAAQVAPINLA